MLHTATSSPYPLLDVPSSGGLYRVQKTFSNSLNGRTLLKPESKSIKFSANPSPSLSNPIKSCGHHDPWPMKAVTPSHSQDFVNFDLVDLFIVQLFWGIDGGLYGVGGSLFHSCPAVTPGGSSSSSSEGWLDVIMVLKVHKRSLSANVTVVVSIPNQTTYPFNLLEHVLSHWSLLEERTKMAHMFSCLITGYYSLTKGQNCNEFIVTAVWLGSGI